MSKKVCRCCKNWKAAVFDLHTAIERLNSGHLFDDEIKKWAEAYRNGVVAVENRFRNTMSDKYCPEPENEDANE